MARTVTRETDQWIKDAGSIGRIVENCTECGKPTRYWFGGGEYPLCQSCAEHDQPKGDA